MRIAYILLDPGIGVFGTKGASVHVQEVIRALRADGHQVTVFCTRTDDQVPADLADLDVRRRLPKGSGAERERAVAEASAAIAAEIAAEGFDLAYERYSLFSDALVRLATPATGAPTPGILEVNAPLIEEQRRHRHLHDESAAQAATRAQLQSAQVVSCVSETVAAWTRGQGASAERVVVTPNGVNTARITPREQTPSAAAVNPVGPVSPERPVTVGFVGTLKPWHGTDLLLRALARTRGPLRLDICGTGPQQAELQQLAAELGMHERVTFRGAVAPELVPEVLRGFDIATAPYPAGEHYFSPLKVYEYLAAGVPVIASAIGTLPDVLRHGELGVLVEPGDVDALATALDHLAGDPARRARLGRAARETAVAEHDWRSRCRALLETMEVPVA
ncbi:glycosyltransferase family 4 protein [Brachybacterium fresconis]|uniref:D-inositol 3-phosphate glycosyltransferase n=1 Tax=Brachybacterium fresconis TaxID=173363 RepID=A0ABS4YM12_9MICO|nr:glycosyltransferase family 4 protein [Brachybacterium fresconis]MBP2409837.1 glycosyltransferase involved in cell wall biosynthesis [Brachybacterium fresconis]